MSRIHRPAIAVLPLLLAACTPTNTLSVDVWGEDFIERGIPAAADGGDGFIDGWSVTFEAFLVSIGEVTAASGDSSPAFDAPGFRVVDLVPASDGQGQRFGEALVPVGHYDDVGYTVAHAVDAQNVNASEADLAALRAAGASVWVRGRAEREGVIKTFTWAFTEATRYDDCHGTARVGSEPSRTILTIHADHLFYDDLLSEEPNLAFQLIAEADVDGDGEVTAAELRDVDLGPQERYQVGSTGITNLWNFIVRQSTTLGHIDGEGHCERVGPRD